MLTSIKKYLAVLRIYTLINIVLISILPAIIFNQTTGIFLARDIITGVIFWCAIILGKEVMHAKTDHRDEINKNVPLALGIILTLIILITNAISILILVVAFDAFGGTFGALGVNFF